MIEKIRKWVKDKTGVSPIIAIILMVAITVVLAATIYVWVTGFGTKSTTSENAAVTVKGENDQIRVILTKAGEHYSDGYDLSNDVAVFVNGAAATVDSTDVGDGDGNWEVGENIVLYLDSTTSSWTTDDTNKQSISSPTEYSVTVQIMDTVVYDGTVIVS